jgi:hypothetical protein
MRPFLRMCGTLMRVQARHVPRQPALSRSEALLFPPATDLLPDKPPCPSYAFSTPLAFSRPPQRRRSARQRRPVPPHAGACAIATARSLAAGPASRPGSVETAGRTRTRRAHSRAASPRSSSSSARPGPAGRCGGARLAASERTPARADSPSRRCPPPAVSRGCRKPARALQNRERARRASAPTPVAFARGGDARAPHARDAAGGRAGARGQQRLATRGDHAPVREEERVRREPRARARAVRIEPARALAGAIRTEPEYMRAALGAPVRELVRILP